MKVMLSFVNDLWSEGDMHRHNFPYSFGLFNALLKKDHDLQFLDASYENLGFDECKKRISDFQPDVFGISCLAMQHHKHYIKMAELAKEASDAKVVIGGIYPTMLPHLLTDRNIDFIVSGEGEERFPKLLEAIQKSQDPNFDGISFKSNGQLKINPIESYLKNLDEVPLPNYDGLDFEGYANQSSKFSYYLKPNRFPYATTISARGCPYDCVFCTSKIINGDRIRFRSAGNILSELDGLVEKHGIKELIFLDDNFFLHRQRLNQFLQGLEERHYDLEWKTTTVASYVLDPKILERIRKSGCYQLSISPEAGDDASLRLMNKPKSLTVNKTRQIVKEARNLGFQINGYFIYGLPGQTWEQVRQTFRFAEELNLDYCSFNIATPLPNTELYRSCIENGQLSSDFDFTNLNGFGSARIRSANFTEKELQVLRAFEWDRINFSTPEKRRVICDMMGIDELELEQWRINTRRSVH